MDSSWQDIDAYFASSTPHTPDVDSERYVSYQLADLYPDWHDQAHCAGVGVNYYFGDEEEQPTMSIKQVRQATKLCDVCPVFRECITWAITNREAYGVWAGTSGRTRKKIFRMIDDGDTTSDEVIGAICDGRGSEYRNRGNASSRRDRDDQPREGVVPEAARKVQ